MLAYLIKRKYHLQSTTTTTTTTTTIIVGKAEF
jgi:hypothetical protein